MQNAVVPAANREEVAEPAAAKAAPQVATDADLKPSATAIATPQEIKSAQQHLQFLGYDIPDASGVLDIKTKVAILQFQDSIGAKTSGELTHEQLQLLFVKVAAQSVKKE